MSENRPQPTNSQPTDRQSVNHPATSARPIADREATRWVQTRLAHEALMLEDAQAVLRHSRELTRAHARAMGLEVPEHEDDEMIHIGDLYQQTPATPCNGTTSVSGTSASTVSSLLKKTAIAAALLTTGGLGVASLGVGGAWLASRVGQIAQQENAAREDTSRENATVVDRDTLFELRLSPGETTPEPQQ